MNKKVFWVALSSLCFVSSLWGQDSPLITINGKQILKSDFEYYYNKNNVGSSVEKKSSDEYLQMYIDFKLKVAEAEALKLDTVKAFVNELQGYRNQLTAPYLIDKEAKDRLMKQAFERMKEEVEIAHIIIKLNQDKPNDTIQAYQKAQKIMEQLKTEDFTKVAKQWSEDENVSQTGGNIGFISALKTIYLFENAAYNTKVGQIAGPIRSMYGYHIVKVISKRPSRGRLKVAHILKFTNDTIPGKNIQAQNDIQNLYAKIKSGEDFGKLAKENSEDTYSAQQNGELNWIEAGNTIKEFEDAAFKLKEIGDVSLPIKSKFGWHIIKLLDRKMVDSFEDEKAEIERSFMHGDRADLLRDAFIAKLKKEYNYLLDKKAMDQLRKLADAETDSVFYLKGAALNKTLFTFADKKYTQGQLVSYMKENKNPDVFLSLVQEDYAGKELFQYEKSRLEAKYPDLKYMLQEYRDGSLLFNISSQRIWEKAMNDTLGLNEFYEKNKLNYTWDTPRFKGKIYYCNNKKTEQKVRVLLKTQPTDSLNSKYKALNSKGQVVKVEQGTFIKGSNKVVDFYVFKTGTYTPSSEYPLIFTEGKVLDKPEKMNDVKGQVVQDYQSYLDKEWVKELRAKYTVEVNQELFKTIK